MQNVKVLTFTDAIIDIYIYYITKFTTDGNGHNRIKVIR